jgi:hypothetical protein
MKLTIKPKAEKTIQRNLRVAVSINEQMNKTAALADELGVDYHVTIVAAVQLFDADLHTRLLDMKAKGERATTSGITPGIESIPDVVGPTPSITDANGIAPLHRVSTTNSADPDRA